MDIFIRMLWKAPRALPAQRQIVLGRRCVVAPSAAKQSALPGPGGVVQPQRWRGLLRVATEKTVVHFSVSRNFSPRAENRGCCCGAAQEWWCADESNKWSDAHHGGGGSRRKAAEGNRLGNGFTSVLLFHSLRTYGQIDRFQVDFKWEEEEEGGGGGGWWRRRVLGWSGGTKINTISKPPMWPVSIAKHFTPAPTQPRKHTHTHTICPTSQTVTMIHTIDNTHQTHPDTYTRAARCYQSTNVSLKVIDTPQKHSDNLISVFWLTDGNLLELLGDLLLYSVLSHFLQPMSSQKLLNHNPKACLLLDYGPFTTISQSFFFNWPKVKHCPLMISNHRLCH